MMQLVAVFKNEDDLLNAIDIAQEKKYKINEVYTPYPIHAVFEKLKRKSNIVYAAYLYGFVAVICILCFLYFTSAKDWPLNYGGKPFAPIPTYIVLTLVITILIVTITSLISFGIRSKIYPTQKTVILDKRATDDKFVISFNGEDEKMRDKIKNVLTKNKAEEVYLYTNKDS